jgi:peptidoglycan/LPS O-acetylase OafA/YrhL
VTQTFQNSGVARGASGRIESLDGLRGVAALIVLVHHSLLVLPAMTPGYYDRRVVGWLPNVMTFTPLHLVWAGRESVYLFFVLSGFVLTLPILRRGRTDWWGYYPARLIRLYLPVLAAVLFSAVLAIIVRREGMVGRSEWLEQHDHAYGIVDWVRNATLLSPNFLNSALWSLRWEMLFSLLLPVYVVLAVRFRRQWWVLGLIAVVGAVAGEATGVNWLNFPPIFMLGCALAAGWDDLAKTSARTWGVVTFVAAVLLTARWWLAPVLPEGRADLLTLPIVLLAAAALVAAAGFSAAFRRLLNLRVVHWLGTISFSLYLTHEPIIVSLALLFPADKPWLAGVVGVPVALLVGTVFARVVERPSHRLAKNVGGRFRRQ